MRALPLVDRKPRLKAVLPKDPLLIYSEHWPEHGKKLLGLSSRGLEGIMAKRAASKYLSGARTKDWLKIKTDKRQESRDRRLHCSAPVAAAFWGAGACPP